MSYCDEQIWVFELEGEGSRTVKDLSFLQQTLNYAIVSFFVCLWFFLSISSSSGLAKGINFLYDDSILLYMSSLRLDGRGGRPFLISDSRMLCLWKFSTTDWVWIKTSLEPLYLCLKIFLTIRTSFACLSWTFFGEWTPTELLDGEIMELNCDVFLNWNRLIGLIYLLSVSIMDFDDFNNLSELFFSNKSSLFWFNWLSDEISFCFSTSALKEPLRSMEFPWNILSFRHDFLTLAVLRFVEANPDSLPKDRLVSSWIPLAEF